MDYQGMSMIVEIQFLLKFMGESKERIHHLYEITRSNEFINEMVNITNIATDKQEQLLFLIHSGQDNSEGVAQLARFLVSYRNEVDLGKLDKMGLNAFHYVCKLGKMKMLKLLFNVTTRDQWKLFLNMPADIPTKPYCAHLAIMYDHHEFVKEFTQMSLSKKYSGIFSTEVRNAKSQTPMTLALETRKYLIVQSLFDERLYLIHIINRIINLCLTSPVEFDAAAPTKCKNYKFFQQLLTVPGARPVTILANALYSRRVEYFLYLLEVNNSGTFPQPFNCIECWQNISKYCINKRIFAAMINTNIKGIVNVGNFFFFDFYIKTDLGNKCLYICFLFLFLFCCRI